MNMPSKLYGDWKRAGIVLRNLSTNITVKAQARLYEDGELVLKKMVEHIDNQDLSWTPLSTSTIRLKNGDDTVYVETGWLKENLSVRRLKSSKKGSSIFIGANAWKKHEDTGIKFSDLMIWLEFGTPNMPPRPLIRPTFEEIQSDIQKNWKDLIIEAAGGR